MTGFLREILWFLRVEPSAYYGGILIQPSSLTVSPFIIGLSIIVKIISAKCSGSPSLSKFLANHVTGFVRQVSRLRPEVKPEVEKNFPWWEWNLFS